MPSEAAVAKLATRVTESLTGMFDVHVGLHEPWFPGNEKQYVTECIESGWVSSVGAFVDRFERMLQEATGARRAVAITNGTTALHLALVVSGVSRDDEVIVPALSFVATANAVSHAGAIPYFVDVSPTTLGIEPDAVAELLADVAEIRDDGNCWNQITGRRIAACVPMHTFGHPVEIDRLLKVCNNWRIPVVEDAAESLGSTFKEQHTGTFGTLGVLSFNGNKIVTTGGGGAILTQDDDTADRVKHLSTTAKVPHAYEFFHDKIAFNYRLPNLNAALGCAQLENLEERVLRKRQLARGYMDNFQDITELEVFEEPEHAFSNYWLNALVLNSNYEGARDKILEATNAAGLATRPAWAILANLPIYRFAPRADVSSAESLARRIINLPSSPFLKPRTVSG